MIRDYFSDTTIVDAANVAINTSILTLTTSIKKLSQTNVGLTRKIAETNNDSHRINEENKLVLIAILEELKKLNENLGGTK